MTMRIKAALVIMAIVFAFTASCFLLSLFFTRYNMTAAMEQEISLAMDIADTVVSTKISLLKSNGETLAERLKAVPDAKMQEVMAAQLEEFTDFFALTVFDKNGVIASKGTPITTADMLEEREYIQIAYEGDIVLSSTLYDDETLEFIMYVFVPMDSGRILGATIPGLFFSDLLSEYRLWQTGNIFMTDAEGTFLANYRPYLVLEKHNFIEDAKTDPELKTAGEFYREMISKDNGSGKYFFGGEERLCVYKRITGSVTGWYIGVAAPLNEGPQKNIRRGLLLASLLFLAVGIIVSVFVSAVAIKPFKTIQAQAAQIHGEHERARLLLDATPLACRLWDKDYKIFDYNEESLKLFNLKDGQEFVDRYYDLSPEYQPDGQSTREKTVKMLNKAFKEGRCVFEWMNQTLDGTPIPTEVTLVRVPYGNDHAVAGYSRDLREQKQMMGELERRDYLMNIINDAAGILLRSEIDAFAEDLHSCMGVIAEALGMDRISIWKNYREDGLLYYSQAFEWGAGLESHKNKAGAYNKYSSVKEPRCYSKVVPSWEETLSKGININRLLRDMPPLEQPHFAVQGILSVFITPVFMRDQFWGFVGYDSYSSEKIFTVNEQAIMRSGGLLIANALLRNEMMLNIRDSSVKLAAALNEAQNANEAKSNFLANMSHEMRTPLNAVLGLSELSLGNKKLDEDTYSNLEKINNAGATLLGTVNDILDISKIEAGKFDLTLAEYDIPSLLNDTITQNILRIGEKNIKFVLNISEDLPTRLFGDELRIKQIFNNLLSNAFKYTKEGTVELSVSCIRDGDVVWLTGSVKDTGVGIKAKDMGNLFAEYYQMDVRSNRKIEGTGLGLSITKRLAEMMGGSVAVESEYGKGSIFTVNLRQGFVQDAVIGPEVVENLKNFRYADHKRRINSKMVRIDLSYARVLVADDNLTNLDVAKGLMKPYGMQVDCVISGQQAIDAIREEKVRYSAVFMDHMMPGMDGVEATQLIRAIGTEYAKNIPVIALTANAIAGNEEMFLSKGFQAFVPKPIEINRLDDILRRFVRDKNLEQGIMVTPPPPAVIKKAGDFHWRIDGIDLQRGLELFNGDEEAFLQVLHSYATHTGPLLKDVEKLSVNNLADYAICVHGIKGSSRSICAEDVGAMAEALEKAAKSNDKDFVAANNQAFIETVERLIYSLTDMLKIISAENPKPKKDKPDKELLARLLVACENYDMDGVDEVMSGINAYEYESDGGLALWLKDNVAVFNFTQIKEKLAGLGEINGGAI